MTEKGWLGGENDAARGGCKRVAALPQGWRNIPAARFNSIGTSKSIPYFRDFPVMLRRKPG
jgi:hypothetical protein